MKALALLLLMPAVLNAQLFGCGFRERRLSVNINSYGAPGRPYVGEFSYFPGQYAASQLPQVFILQVCPCQQGAYGAPQFMPGPQFSPQSYGGYMPYASGPQSYFGGGFSPAGYGGTPYGAPARQFCPSGTCP